MAMWKLDHHSDGGFGIFSDIWPREVDALTITATTVYIALQP